MDALKLRLTLITPMIATRYTEKLERSNLCGALHVWTSAKIGEIAVDVKCNCVFRGNIIEPPELESLVALLKKFAGFITTDNASFKGLILRNHFRHFSFNCLKIIRRNRIRAINIIEEARLSWWPDIEFGFGI